MERIYRVTLFSSLAQALVCGLLYSSLLPGGFVVAILSFASVWIELLFFRRRMQQGVIPYWGEAVSVGSALGALCALSVCFLVGINLFDLGVLFAEVSVIGAVVGIPLGLVNFVAWRALGLFRFVHRPADDAALDVAEEGVWPPPPQRPDGNLPHR